MIYKLCMFINRILSYCYNELQYSCLSHFFSDSRHHSIVYVIKFNKVLLTLERNILKNKFLVKFVEDCCSMCWLCHIFLVTLEVHSLTLRLQWEFCGSS